MKNLISSIFLFASFFAVAQNPICPPSLNIADPTARLWKDGKLYVYGSHDTSQKSYCSDNHWVLSTSDLKKWDYFPDAFNST